MKRLITLLALVPMIFVGTQSLKASASDSINVQHYSIRIDTLDFTTQSIEANTTVSCRSLVNSLGTFTLDLLKLTIDSIKVDGNPATWTYNDTLLRVNSPTTFNAGDFFDVQVWYHGSPKKDASTFGGFYFSGNYVYNIGVAFVADPHNFGRVWFPCKDNFTDRATYDFSIRTLNTRIAVCGGTLQSEVDNGDGTITWNWSLADSIPTYLASFAAADYTSIRDTFISITGDSIPVALYMRSADSLKVASQFAKLKIGFDGFEQRFGPYQWERVGYVMVPFNGGAMEHATNIAYPTAVLGGGLSYEYLWAHELSHSWFGNHVTCEEAPEMWLNEGFAAYCEAIFMEAAYGPESYKTYVRANLAEVLRKTHRSDGGFFAISGVSHENTYGSTVYDKGASVVHSIRGHMGDTAFFAGIQHCMVEHAQSHMNSDSLRISLEHSSGIPMSDFFDGWVYSPGFPHFSVDSFSIASAAGSYDVTVHVRQRMYGRTTLTSGNILELGFKDAAGNYEVKTITFSGATGSATFNLPFSPTLVLADPNEKLADAETDDAHYVFGPTAPDFHATYMEVQPVSYPDSAWMRVTHNWVKPDHFKSAVNGIRLSNSRFWLLEGMLPSGFLAKGIFTFDGRSGTSSSCTTCLLDDGWLDQPEDSLLIFWRQDRADDWHLVNGYTINFSGSHTDKRGTIIVDTLRMGEYAMGLLDYSVVSTTPANPNIIPSLTIAPNPANHDVTFKINTDQSAEITILDMNGRTISQHQMPAGQQRLNVSTSRMSEGVYLIQCRLGTGEMLVNRLVVTH